MAENFFGLTDTGRLRNNNEDAFLADKLSNGWILACVIDGVGGYEGGEVAAGIAKETILQNLQRLQADVLQVLRTALLQANQNIYREKSSGNGNSQMACVLTLALVDTQSNQFYYAHVGDTRLYLLRDGSLVKVTKDQSFVGFLEDSGRLSEAEAMAHPKRNEINKALGFDPQIELQTDYIETGASPFLPGDALLLCSDGLTDLVNNKDMTAMLLAATSLSQKAQALIDAANNAGGKDNITVVLVKHDKKPLKQKATKPVLVKKNRGAEATKAAPAPVVSRPLPTAAVVEQKSNVMVWVFAFLTLLFAAVAAWLWSKNRQLEAALPVAVGSLPMSDAESKLSNAVGLVSRELILSPDSFGKTITISDTLFIRQDSLHINGAGLVLEADSTYNGPAIFVTGNCRYLLLENFVFRNFKTGIVTQGKGFQFKNVVFQNSALPVLQEVSLHLGTDTLNGRLTDSLFFKKNPAR
jgi:serine/threonine protein phosphatase PrpC